MLRQRLSTKFATKSCFWDKLCYGVVRQGGNACSWGGFGVIRWLRKTQFDMILNSKCLVGCLAWIFIASARADDWPQWLGPKRDAVWRETGIMEKFPSE